MWTYFYHRTINHMGDIAHHLVPQKELSRLAHPFYHQLARGGEGYMEVGKNVYYTVNHLCHMVLALKPFGCMPSTQSDGFQSWVVNKFKDMIFLPIETSGEGEVNAHSRVQMALAEAKAKRSLGASSSFILSLLLKETLPLALVGTGIGVVLTCLAKWSLEHIGHSGLTQETVYSWWPIAGAIAVTGAVLGAVAPHSWQYAKT
jgi:hypothetical protein